MRSLGYLYLLFSLGFYLRRDGRKSDKLGTKVTKTRKPNMTPSQGSTASVSSEIPIFAIPEAT